MAVLPSTAPQLGVPPTNPVPVRGSALRFDGV